MELQEYIYIYIYRERERVLIFSGEKVRENNRFIENKMRRKREKIKDIIINTKLSKSSM